MGLHHSKAGKARRESNGRSARSVTAALRAVDTRNVHKLQKALKVGAAIGNVRRPPGTGPSSSSSTNSTITTGSNSDSTTQSHSTSLLEYAVEKNFIAGVDIMLKVRLRFPLRSAVQKCEWSDPNDIDVISSE